MFVLIYIFEILSIASITILVLILFNLRSSAIMKHIHIFLICHHSSFLKKDIFDFG